MKIRLLLGILFFALVSSAVNAEQETVDPNSLKGQLMTAQKDLNSLRAAVQKELKDDAKYKELMEKKKILEKEITDYLYSKKPQMLEMQKKNDDLKSQIDAEKKKIESEKKAKSAK